MLFHISVSLCSLQPVCPKVSAHSSVQSAGSPQVNCSLMKNKTVHHPKSQWKNPSTNRSLPFPKPAVNTVCELVCNPVKVEQSTRCQSLVLCWWAVQRCCSGGVLASSRGYCSESPGKNKSQRWSEETLPQATTLSKKSIVKKSTQGL